MAHHPDALDHLRPAAPTRAAGVAVLARDLADFLVEFSSVLHKRTMYPPGHPYLEESAARFVLRLETLLARRGALVIGVARRQLLIGGGATDTRNVLLRDLARRLHRQRIASLRIQEGVTVGEVGELLRELCADPSGPPGPLGLDPSRSAGWTHLQVEPPDLGRLQLEDADSGDDERPGESAELWMGLATLALATEGDDPGASDDPLVLARAIDQQLGQAGYDRLVLDYLARMVQEISAHAGAWEPEARDRVSRLIAGLHPATLRSLLRAGADNAERRRFVQAVSESLTADAVVKVIEAAAATSGQTISDHFLRLLHKLAHHASESESPTSAEAEAALRENLAKLISGWELEDPNPAEYTAVLDGLVREAPLERATEAEVLVEAEGVLRIALETDCLAPRVFALLDLLALAGRFSQVAALLAEAPSTATADALWERLATPQRLQDQLAASPIDFVAVEGLALRLGGAAVDPLLDLLDGSPDQTTRSRLLRLLGRLGEPAGVAAVARLERSPWYMQRNILVLLRGLEDWPDGFTPLDYIRHADQRVRLEAFRLLLERPLYRPVAISEGLEDTDDGIVRLVLQAALISCPPDSVAAVDGFLAAGRRSPELRALALRVLAGIPGRLVVPRLVELAGRRRLLRGWRLAAKSPVVLAAVGVLARDWGSDPTAAAMVSRARTHADPDFRSAAEGRLG